MKAPLSELQQLVMDAATEKKASDIIILDDILHHVASSHLADFINCKLKGRSVRVTRQQALAPATRSHPHQTGGVRGDARGLALLTLSTLIRK